MDNASVLCQDVTNSTVLQCDITRECSAGTQCTLWDGMVIGKERLFRFPRLVFSSDIDGGTFAFPPVLSPHKKGFLISIIKPRWLLL